MIAALAAALLTPVPPLPEPRQIAWHRLERYAFVHFGPNTFTGVEWGKGTEPADTFQPTALDCRQWCRVFRDAGLKGVILTAKHHDGFCLWPSKFSSHTVAQSPWKGGKGDVLRELSEACREFGLQFGVYVSPWDRNHPAYGTPAYNDVFVKMLEEVLTGYGPVFEVWFDGANGEGPNGKRQEYDWQLFVSTVRRLQPNAVIFSDAGPDVRWVGNEEGHAPENCWPFLLRDELRPGTDRYRELGVGHENGTHYVPAECDVSIRPGWFWRETENDKVKTVEQLVDLYERSVGHGATFLLNVPPDTRGLIHEVDAARLREWRAALDRRYSHDLVRGRHGVLTDGDPETYALGTTFEVDLGARRTVERVVLQEPIHLGVRCRRFRVEVRGEGGWRQVAEGTTIGAKKIVRVPPTSADAVRVTVLASRTPEFALSTIEVY